MTIQDYVQLLTEKHIAKYKENGFTFAVPFFEITTGPKYTKIILKEKWEGQERTGGSVHCFVNNETGDIYKAASWNAPAKGSRGNINNDTVPIFGRDFYKIKL